jgi:hypothetical protein
MSEQLPDDSAVSDFSDEALRMIDLAATIARKLLTKSDITPMQIIAIGKALEALKRMPEWIINGYVKIGLEYRAGDREFHEMRYYQICIDSDALTFESGGSVYDRSVGSDSFSDEEIQLQSDGRIIGSRDLDDWEVTFNEFFGMESGVCTEDECELLTD